MSSKKMWFLKKKKKENIKNNNFETLDYACLLKSLQTQTPTCKTSNTSSPLNIIPVKLVNVFLNAFIFFTFCPLNIIYTKSSLLLLMLPSITDLGYVSKQEFQILSEKRCTSQNELRFWLTFFFFLLWAFLYEKEVLQQQCFELEFMMN